MNYVVKSIKELYVYTNDQMNFNARNDRNNVCVNILVDAFKLDDCYYISSLCYKEFINSIETAEKVNVQHENNIYEYYKIISVNNTSPLKRNRLQYVNYNKFRIFKSQCSYSKYIANSIFNTNEIRFIETIENDLIFYINGETNLEAYFGFGKVIVKTDENINNGTSIINFNDVFKDFWDAIGLNDFLMMIVNYYALFMIIMFIVNYKLMFYISLDFILKIVSVTFAMSVILYLISFFIELIKINKIYKYRQNNSLIVINKYLIVSNSNIHKVFLNNIVKYYTLKKFSNCYFKDTYASRQLLVHDNQSFKGDF